MFEFAISQHKRRPPTKQIIASWVVSCLAHVAALLILVENPGLLRTGMHLWFKPPTRVSRVLADQNWRNVAYVGSASKMVMPSTESLKKYVYSWNRGESSKGPPPIRVRWGDETPKDTASSVKPVLGTEEPKLPRDASAVTTSPASEGPGATGDPSRTAVPVTATATPSENKPKIYLPAPEWSEPRQRPKKVTEVASNITPEETNKTGGATPEDKVLSPPRSKDEPKVFENEQSAIRTEGSGLFDTKGFPLGEYASIIIERIKGNWSIPSNLRNSQGRSTLIFFIEKDGQLSGLRVVTPSGSDSLDLAALNSVLGSIPFPPLPRGFPGEHVGAKFIFSYNERQ